MRNQNPTKKKTKVTKKVKKRGNISGSESIESLHSEEVRVETALPPLVSGQLRCYLKLCINQILWLVPSPPNSTYVRVKWWGEAGEGTIFRPNDVKKSGTFVKKTTARYSIRSGPKQFAAYLNDMSCLVMDVLSGPLMKVVGQCTVENLASLSPSLPLNGFFPVLSSEKEKIAELQASVMLESILSSYDSQTSIPTTDMNEALSYAYDINPSHPPEAVPIVKTSFRSSITDPFISPVSQVPSSKDGKISCNEKSDLGVSYWQDIHEKPVRDIGLQPEILKKSSSDDNRVPLDPTSQAGLDLVTALLNKGKKLREAMVVSALDTDIKANDELSRIDVDAIISSKRRNSTGELFREILSEEDEKNISDSFYHYQGSNLSGVENSHQRAVDLVLGPSLASKEYKMLKAMANGHDDASSLSEDDDANLSDPADPIHDESLLQELFYQQKGQTSINESIDLSSTEDESDLKQLKPKKRGKRIKHKNTSLEDIGNMRPSSKSSSVASNLEHHGNGETRDLLTGQEDFNFNYEEDDNVSLSHRSDSSRVSFEMAPSDNELENEIGSRNAKPDKVDGLSVERLTLLGRIQVARVAIDTLQLINSGQHTAGKKIPGRGKPPKPVKSQKPNTYFVEYQFPVVASSRDKYTPNAMATEVMRVASKKVQDSEVVFGHRSIFPVLFDGAAIEKWWKFGLVFKLFSRYPGQKMPTNIGTCSVPLKSVLKSGNLHVPSSLLVKEKSERNGSCLERPIVGRLKVSIELASDSKDFANALAKTRLAEMKNPKLVQIPQPKSPARLPPTPPASSTLTSAKQGELISRTVAEMASVKHISPPTHVADSIRCNDSELLTLHTILMVSDGKNINLLGSPCLQHLSAVPSQPPKPITGLRARDLSTRNPYVVCRMFWCSDIVRSDVCWGTFEPQFNFSQVAPVLVTPALLERMKNNFMVIEVWDKKASSDSDKLIGLVKLSLHQFYMSFRDQRITNALLKGKYPILSVDSYMPIIDPFSGTQFGQIKVLFGMGSMEQVSALQLAKNDPQGCDLIPQKPEHFLERQEIVGTTISPIPTTSTEHVFEVVVEGIRDLSLLSDMIWGEADAFIQYHFPSQIQQQQLDGHIIKHATPSLKPYRTATTLCIPDPVFHDITKHRIILPTGTPVQREILTACAGAGGGAGGIPFEFWCRYYSPNVRDQVLAKAVLPLAKLCAMVTMQKHGETSIQSFSLPLTLINPDDDDNNMEPGHVDVTINYKTSVVQTKSDNSHVAASRNLSSSNVCITVGIIRASALKAAADKHARLNRGMQFASEVGVNSYIKIKISFLSDEDERITRTIARSFAPEFSTQLDFPCPLLWTEAGTDALCLAEILESAEVEMEIWHQIPGLNLDNENDYVSTGADDMKMRKLMPGMTDVLLGTVTVSLKSLLSKRTGIKGWYPVKLSKIGWDKYVPDVDETVANTKGHGLERVVGGVELSIKFAHHDDRDRVLNAGRSVGWSPDLPIEEDDWQDADEMAANHFEIGVSVENVCFPVENTLLTGHTKIDPETMCYIRYKFYDKVAVCSRVRKVDAEGHYVNVDLKHTKTTHVRASAPFFWYLREELLEIQVWVTYSDDSDQKRPRHRDKLIGSAFIDMLSLNDRRRKQHRISGVYPLFKPGSSNLGGAYIMTHITMRSEYGHTDGDFHDETLIRYDELPSDDELSPMRKRSSGGVKQLEKPYLSKEETFAAHITIEKAMHLVDVVTKHVLSDSFSPNCYVTYQTGESLTPAFTEVVTASNHPVWNYEHDARLPKELLQEKDKNLVFKAWHKIDPTDPQPDKSCDRVLGFISVDISPLTLGLSHICGWYNIMDFNGQCQGQIKLSVTPCEHVLGIKASSLQMSPSKQTSFIGPYQTSGVYTSFPSHITRYSDQLVRAPLLPQMISNNELQSDSQQTGVRYWVPTTLPAANDDDKEETSRSMLFRNLRANLDDLDMINQHFTKKLGNIFQDNTASAANTNKNSDLPTFTSEQQSQFISRPVMSLFKDIEKIPEFPQPKSSKEDMPFKKPDEKSITDVLVDQDDAISQGSDAIQRARDLLRRANDTLSETSSTVHRAHSPGLQSDFDMTATDVVDVTRLSESARSQLEDFLKYKPSEKKVASAYEGDGQSDDDDDIDDDDDDDYISRKFLEFESKCSDREMNDIDDVADGSVIEVRPLNNVSCFNFKNSTSEPYSMPKTDEFNRYLEVSDAASEDGNQTTSKQQYTTDIEVDVHREDESQQIDFHITTDNISGVQRLQSLDDSQQEGEEELEDSQQEGEEELEDSQQEGEEEPLDDKNDNTAEILEEENSDDSEIVNACMQHSDEETKVSASARIEESDVSNVSESSSKKKGKRQKVKYKTSKGLSSSRSSTSSSSSSSSSESEIDSQIEEVRVKKNDPEICHRDGVALLSPSDQDNEPPSPPSPPRYPARPTSMPQFFLPPRELAESMRQLRFGGSCPGSTPPLQDTTVSDERQQEKAKVAKELLQKISSPITQKPSPPLRNIRQRPLPSAEETKRIAKIFSSRFSSTGK